MNVADFMRDNFQNEPQPQPNQNLQIIPEENDMN